MKKMKYFWGCLLIISIISTSCSENDDLNDIRGNAEGKYIEFALRRSSTRTIYADQDGSTDKDADWQINWEENDPIRIYCAQAQTITQSSNADASYKVTDIDANNGSLTKINENALQWGTASTHDFFAVFPDDGKKIAGYDHTNKIITFNFNANQTIKEVKKNGENYIAVPDMNNAYMVASKIGVQNGKTVNLAFDPIMTTLEINIKGQPAVKTIITGVSVVTTFNDGESVISADGCFRYDIKNKSIKIVKGAKASTQTIFVDLSKHNIIITGENTVNLTVFVPPVLLNNSNTKIQVHSTTETQDNVIVNSGVSRIALPSTITPSYKKIINLPNLKSPVSNNNWITPLDDNIYVSQLSIPGTHDSGTGYGTSMGYATLNGLDWAAELINGVIGDPGVTQALNIEQQWDLGIRAFDFRVAYSTKSKSFILWHGLVACHDGNKPITFEDEINKLYNKMLGTQEFAIVLLRHEDETASILEGRINFTAKDVGKWKSDFPTILKKLLDDKKAIMWNPELTIGDAAGKIVFLCRDWTKYTDDNSNIVGAYTSWGHAKEGINGSIYNSSGSNMLYLQDWYASNASNDGTSDYLTDKCETLKKHLDIAAKFADNKEYPNNKTLPWMINHCSGYTDTNSSTQGYKNNAAKTNLETYKYISGTEKREGPTGIIMMDYVGARQFGTTVYGDLCPQVIIDNNYKLVLKRKTDN